MSALHSTKMIHAPPKPELIRKLADVLEIAPEYLSIPVPSTPEEIKVIEFWQEELSSSD